MDSDKGREKQRYHLGSVLLIPWSNEENRSVPNTEQCLGLAPLELPLLMALQTDYTGLVQEHLLCHYHHSDLQQTSIF